MSEPKEAALIDGVVVIEVDDYLTTEQRESIHKQVGIAWGQRKVAILEKGMRIAKCPTASAIEDHAAAIRELAQAIREHAYLMATDEPDEEAEPQFYMDGTPVRQ